jgi:antitoxin HicB
MDIFAFPALLDASEDGLLVTFRDVPEAITHAADRAEALALAEDSLTAALEFSLGRNRLPPRPSPLQPGEALITVEPVLAARCVLALAMAERGLSKVALAERLGKSETVVRRMLDGRTKVRIESVLAALSALGLRAGLGVSPA